MTCIVGYENDSGVWVGGDGNWSWNDTRERMATPKVFAKDGAIWGIAGDARTAQVLQYAPEHLVFPYTDKHFTDALFTRFLATYGVQYIRRCLEAESCIEIDKDTGRESMSSSIVIAYKGMLREIRPHFGVFHSKEPYVAAGSGAEFAMGAMFAMRTRNARLLAWNGGGMVEIALEAAARHEAHVSEPFTVLFSPRKDE